jgi:hypothetical protein
MGFDMAVSNEADCYATSCDSESLEEESKALLADFESMFTSMGLECKSESDGVVGGSDGAYGGDGSDGDYAAGDDSSAPSMMIGYGFIITSLASSIVFLCWSPLWFSI